MNSGSIVVGSRASRTRPTTTASEVFFSTGEKTNGGTKPETLPVNNGGDLGQKKEWVEAILAEQAGEGAVELRLRGPADRGVPAGQRGDPHRQGVQLGRREVRGATSRKPPRCIRRTYRKGWDLIGYNA